MTTSWANGTVAALLERHGRMLELVGESPFRTRAFTRAADNLRMLSEEIATVAAEGRLREIPGIGEGISIAIEQILESGTFDAHQELTSRYPESLVELTTIPGIGAKTALRLFSLLGVHDLTSLDSALDSGQVSETKGLGPRVEATLRSGLEALQRRTGRTPLGSARPVFDGLVHAYNLVRPNDRISLAGSARRWEITVEDLDVVVASPDITASMKALSSLPMVSQLVHETDRALRLHLASGIMVDAYFTVPEGWGSTLVRATGNEQHLARLGDIPELLATEDEVYAYHNLPYIPPELRAGHEEFERWEEISELITLGDITGEFHTHTVWSDGSASIREMAEAAASRAYSVLGITDHSHGLGIAGGLDVMRINAQRLEIDDADGIDGVKLLAGGEVEVHRDGTLDFDDETLARLDVVVASLHTGLRQQSQEELTARLERVLKNPNVDIIAHPSGRLIERREGGAFDWEKVFATAAVTGTALEINADPARLDLDPELARQANQSGCLITINCDAHHPSGFALMEYGVAMARRAWLKPDHILNCWPRTRILEWLNSRGQPM